MGSSELIAARIPVKLLHTAIAVTDVIHVICVAHVAKNLGSVLRIGPTLSLRKK